jgi:hypothetical protein
MMPKATWVPALRSSVKNAAPRPGHERYCFTSLSGLAETKKNGHSFYMEKITIVKPIDAVARLRFGTAAAPAIGVTSTTCIGW